MLGFIGFGGDLVFIWYCGGNILESFDKRGIFFDLRCKVIIVVVVL